MDVEVPGEDGDLSSRIPSASSMDHIRAVMLGSVGALPFAGAPLQAIVGEIWQSDLQGRLESFLREVAERIESLEAVTATFGLEDLKRRLAEEQVSLVGARAAMSAATADSRKMAYLAQAVANVVATTTWDGRKDLTLILVRLIDELTATHLQVLDLLTDPRDWEQRNGPLKLPTRDDGRILVRDLVRAGLPHITDHELLFAVLSDLEARHLIDGIGAAETGATLPTRNAALDGLATPLGRDLLGLITRGVDESPEE